MSEQNFQKSENSLQGIRSLARFIFRFAEKGDQAYGRKVMRALLFAVSDATARVRDIAAATFRQLHNIGDAIRKTLELQTGEFADTIHDRALCFKGSVISASMVAASAAMSEKAATSKALAQRTHIQALLICTSISGR